MVGSQEPFSFSNSFQIFQFWTLLDWGEAVTLINMVSPSHTCIWMSNKCLHVGLWTWFFMCSFLTVIKCLFCDPNPQSSCHLHNTNWYSPGKKHCLSPPLTFPPFTTEVTQIKLEQNQENVGVSRVGNEKKQRQNWGTNTESCHQRFVRCANGFCSQPQIPLTLTNN